MARLRLAVCPQSEKLVIRPRTPAPSRIESFGYDGFRPEAEVRFPRKWASPGFPDTGLMFLSRFQPFINGRTHVVERRVSAPRIVEALDVIEDIGSGLVAGAIASSVDPLDL